MFSCCLILVFIVRFVSLDQPYQNQNDCDDQEYVDKSAHGVGRNQSQQPGDDQDEGKRVKHMRIILNVSAG